MAKGKRKSPSNSTPFIPPRGGKSWHNWSASRNMLRAKEEDHK